MLTTVYAILFYVATAVLAGGLFYRVFEYWSVPAPLKIVTTPAPTTRSGVVWRMIKELTVFESLFKANKWIWLFGIMFHAALLLVVLRHFRYFITPGLSELIWMGVTLVQPFGLYAGFAMIAGLLGLWFRRLFVPRVRYISAPSDHLMLLLLIAIGTSGLFMRYVARTDIIALKAFFMGLMTFNWQELPGDPLLLIHLALVAVLMIIFPFSKLLHAPGVFFSPGRYQVDNPRERRHLAPWAKKLES